jgi:hypothetical protein
MGVAVYKFDYHEARSRYGEFEEYGYVEGYAYKKRLTWEETRNEALSHLKENAAKLSLDFIYCLHVEHKQESSKQILEKDYVVAWGYGARLNETLCPKQV